MNNPEDRMREAARRFGEKLDEFVKDGFSELPGLTWRREDGEGIGTLVSKHELGPKGGTIEIRYTPGYEFAERAKRIGMEAARQTLDRNIVVAEGSPVPIPTPREALEAHGEPGEARDETWGEQLALWYGVFYAHVLHNNLSLALKASPREAEFLTSLKISQVEALAAIQTMDSLLKIKAVGLSESISALVDKTADEKRDLLERYAAAMSPHPRWEWMPEHYERLYAVWKDAKKLLDDHGSAWVGMLKAKYADLTFDDDLLARLGGDTSGLRESLLERIEKQGGEPTPSSIALEHAARACGAFKYQVHARTLYRRATQPEDAESESELTDTAA